MNRLIFEDDDVIREALMMDSDANDEHNLIDTGPTPKENTSESVTHQDGLKTNGDKELVVQEAENKQDSKSKCQSCLQEFEELEHQNHDCVKKKRKSLVLSFYKNQPIAFSRNVKSSRKSVIENDTAKFDRRQSINSNTSEKIDKHKYKESSCDKNTSKDDEKRQHKTNKSKTPIFYECSLCSRHFTKNEIDVHICRDSSPCLTLKFSTSSSFNDSVDKNKLKKPKKSVIHDELQLIDKKHLNDKEKVQVKHKRDSTKSLSTELKRNIKSQQLEIKNITKTHNQPILLETEMQKDTIREISMKRKSVFEKCTEKVNEPKTKRRKLNNETNQSEDTTTEGSVDVNKTTAIEMHRQNSTTKITDQPRKSAAKEKNTEKVNETKTEKSKQNSETNQSVHTTIDGSVGVNKTVSIKTRSENSITNITDQPKDRNDVSKNETSDISTTLDSKSTPQIKKHTISENKQTKVHSNEVGTSPKKYINQMEEHKSIVKSCSVVLNKLDIQLKQNVAAKKPIVKLESKEMETSSYSNKLLSKTLQTDEKSSKNRLDKLIIPSKKENKKAEVKQRNKQGIDTTNIIYQKEAKQIVTKSQTEERKIDKKSEKLLNQDKISSLITGKMSKRHKKSSKNRIKNVISEKYNLFRLNELKVLLEKEKESSCDNLVSSSKVGTIKKEILDSLKDEKELISQPEQSQSRLRKLNENSEQLLNQVKTSSQNNDKQSKMGEKSTKIIANNVIPEKHKLLRFNEQKVLLEKEKGTSCKNLEKRKGDKVTLQNKQDDQKPVETMSKEDENSPIIVKKKNIAETYKMFRLNELKILLEKDKVVTSNRNIENKATESITPRNEQDSTEKQNSKYKKETESHYQNKNNIEINEKNNDSEQQKIIKIESDQEDCKTEIELKKNKQSKIPSHQKKYACRLCHAKFTNINYNHICKNKEKKRKFKKNELQIAKKSDVISNECTNDSQSKINITILSRENVKVVTVSNNAKDYEVNHEVISNYVHYDQASEQNEIKEILTNNISTNETSTETISQSKLNNISGNKYFQNEKTTNDITEISEPLKISQQSDADVQILDINSKEGINTAKTQNNNIRLPKESQTQNKNKKDDEIIDMPTKCIENDAMTENEISLLGGYKDTEININVTTENQITAKNEENQLFKSTNNGNNRKNIDRENRARKTENEVSVITTEKYLPIEITEKNHFGEISNIESTHSLNDEIVGIQIIPESEVTTLESSITLPENIDKVMISDKIGSEITESKSKITISENKTAVPEIVESEVTVLSQNANTTSTQHFDLENKIGSIDSENVKIVQNDRFDSNELTLEENIVSINNVAEKIIVPALEDEIIYVDNKPMSSDIEHHIAVVTHTEDDKIVLVENVGQEVIVTTENTETDDVLIENVRDETVIFGERDNSLVVFQNSDNIVDCTEGGHNILMKNIDNTVIDEHLQNMNILTTQIERNDNNTLVQINENMEHTYSDSTGLTNNEEIAKVSVECLENEVFVPKYTGENVLIKDVQIETNGPTTDVNANVSIEGLLSNEDYFSKQVTTGVSNEALEAPDFVKDTQNETINVGSIDSIDDTNISTIKDNLLIDNMKNTIDEPLGADKDQLTENSECENKLVTSTDKDKSILTPQSGHIEKTIPNNDEIETIIVISSGDENKNIVVTQNEKNETVIIISKRKEKNSADHQVHTSNKIKEITVQDYRNKNEGGNQSNKIPLTEKEDIENERKCLKCSKIFTEDDLKIHHCFKKLEGKRKIGKVAKFRFRNLKKLPKKCVNNNDCGDQIRVKGKEDTSNFNIETQLMSNQNDTQNKILETQKLSSNDLKAQKCDKNNREKEVYTLESQLAVILNQNEHSSNSPGTHRYEENNKEIENNTLESQLAAILDESQNKMTAEQEKFRISSVNNIRYDDMSFDKHGSPITNNQLLDILSKSENSPQVENFNQTNQSTAETENGKTKCSRCCKEFTIKELMTHNCLEYEKTITSNLKIENTSVKLDIAPNKTQKSNENFDKIEVPEPQQNFEIPENNVLYVIDVEEKAEIKEKKCFNCSEVYDKPHKCKNIENPEGNSQENNKDEDTSKIKKNKGYFDAFILKTSNSMYKCKICEKEYKTRKNLVRHVHQHEKDYDKERFKCSNCPKTFQYKSSWKAHEATHTGETYDCAICKKSFSRKTNLYTHMKLHKDEKFKCDICEMEYSNKIYLIKHPCFNTKKYSCNYCDKTYRQKQNLNDHLHSHAGVTPYTCEFCNKKIQFKGTYLSHTHKCDATKHKSINKNPVQTAKHDRNTHLTCKICSKVSKNKSELRLHEWKHENKQFICNFCPKKFKRKHYLQLHLANHAELSMKRKKFSCPHCNKIFCTKFGLNMHINKHNNVKFSCPLCEKVFTTKLFLKTHQRTHTCHNPYVCVNCKKAFNNRSNFNRHRKSKVCFIPPVKKETKIK